MVQRLEKCFDGIFVFFFQRGGKLRDFSSRPHVIEFSGASVGNYETLATVTGSQL
jgi:hypothetical protein